jgi:hypothetical protein
MDDAAGLSVVGQLATGRGQLGRELQRGLDRLPDFLEGNLLPDCGGVNHGVLIRRPTAIVLEQRVDEIVRVVLEQPVGADVAIVGSAVLESFEEGHVEAVRQRGDGGLGGGRRGLQLAQWASHFVAGSDLRHHRVGVEGFFAQEIGVTDQDHGDVEALT